MEKDVILRLSKYKRIAYQLKALGLERIFSNNLADAAGVNPSLVRKDFSILQLPGNKRGGYQVDTVIKHLSEILGNKTTQNIIIVGCGKIGTALMEYKSFIKEDIIVQAGFDINPETIQRDSKIPIYPMEKLEKFIKENKIKVAILAVPESAASKILQKMVNAGITGVLNFAPVRLKYEPTIIDKKESHCIIQNVNLGLEIENIFYLVNAQEQQNEKK